MKTDIDIRKDIYHIVMGSAIKATITGEVSYYGRKTDKEDCVISVLTSLNGQIQDCKVNVNVYVQNMTSGSKLIENVPRADELCNVCKEVFGDGKRSVFGDGFKIFLEKQLVLPVNGRDEHVINNTLRYKFNNE